MSMERPQLLLLVTIVVPLLAIGIVVQAGRYRRLGDAFGGPRAALRLSGTDLYRFPWARLILLVSAVVLVIGAAAGPRIGPGLGFDDSRQIDVQIALDVSASMTGADVGEGRLQRGREVVEAVAGALSGERVGLAVFADWPLELLPPTDDGDLVRFFAESLNAQVVQTRDQGTSLVGALMKAREALDEHGRPGALRVILLITDGESNEDEQAVLDSVALVAKDGVQVWTAGVGTAQGSVLDGSTTEGRAVLDANGQPVVSRLNESLLQRVADHGAGAYYNVTSDAGLNTLVRRLRRNNTTEAGSGSVAWLVAIAILLVVIEGGLDAGVRLRPVLRGRVQQ
jgi:Ca-activated chloride channel family protein